MPVPPAPIPERCQLEHKLFSTLGDVAFLRSETDGVPMMSVQLGERQASIPLVSLWRELCIGEDTPDGRMLDLIGDALDFVTCLQPGDKLPLEIRTGEASWEPDADHLRIATIRLRMKLAAWHARDGRWTDHDDADALLAAGDDLALQSDLMDAAHVAAVELGLRTAADVIVLIDGLGREMAFIEALRQRLLLRVESAGRQCLRFGKMSFKQSSAVETVRQVVRLIVIAYRQLIARFEDVDAQTGEVLSVLRNIDSQRIYIRTHRDWMYRQQRAWEPLLREWDALPQRLDDETAALFTRTYQFLAPRFMPITEWRMSGRGERPKARPPESMVW